MTENQLDASAPAPEPVPAPARWQDPVPESQLPRRKRHWEMLVIASLVTVLAFLLQVMPDNEHIAFRGFERWVVPGTCFSHEVFGVSCPGCGLTRSIIYLAQGDLPSSFRLHHLGWLMALTILFQFPYRIACLKGHATSRRARWLAKAFANGLIFLLFANWFLGLVMSR